MGYSSTMREDIDSLTALGFCGFHTIRELRAKKLSMVPKQKGVYLVLRLSEEPVRFLDKSLGGHFEGKDPKVLIAKLCKEWVDGATILYIGKAGGPIGKAGGPKKKSTKKSTLHSRLKTYLKFGEGKPVSHWGGRLIWQIADSDDLIICWKLITGKVPQNVERKMLLEFKDSHDGKLPFANLSMPSQRC